MRTHLIRLDVEGKQLVRIVIGCVEVAPIDGFFRLLAVTSPFGSILLPRKYEDLLEAISDRDILNTEEHPYGISDRFSGSRHTIPTTIGV